MQILDLVQGTKDWDAARARHNTASEASIMMGASDKATRNDLLRMKATGSEKEFSRWVEEVLFERGHQIEAAARPIAEAFIGEDLFPVTATGDDHYLLASFDGVTLLGDVVWECKSWNKDKAKAVAAGTVPAVDYWQVVHQLCVSQAERALYTISDGTEDGTKHVWLQYDQAEVDRLLAGWRQFDADVAAWAPEPEPAAVEGAKPENLPALRVEVRGEVTASNITEYRDHALAVFEGIDTDLQDDQDFADAEQTTKWCKDVEQRLDAAKDHAQSQMETVDELFRAIDEIREKARAKRLELERLVKDRKQSIRQEIIEQRKQALRDHIDDLEKRVNDECNGNLQLPKIAADFPAAMKNKRTVKSLRDAADQVLADAKLEANGWADRLQANARTFTSLSDGFTRLFPDHQALLLKAPEDLESSVKLRIAEHKAEEEKRLEAERQRAQREEQARADKEARQAAASPETEPSPAVESDATQSKATAQSTQPERDRPQEITADARLTFTVRAGLNDQQIEAELCRKLKAAGITSLAGVRIQRAEEAA